MKSILKIIQIKQPMHSTLGVNTLIEDGDRAIKYSVHKGVGKIWFDVHNKVRVLDEYFLRTQEGYTQSHVTKPIEHFEFVDVDKTKIYSGYTYPFTPGKDNFKAKEIDEWELFQGLMRKAGFEFRDRNYDKGGWAGNGKMDRVKGYFNFRDIVHSGDVEQDKLSKDWAIIDFCGRDITFSKETYERFIKTNRLPI